MIGAKGGDEEGSGGKDKGIHIKMGWKKEDERQGWKTDDCRE